MTGLSPIAEEHMANLMRCYYAYWKATDGNYVAMRRRGYSGMYAWQVYTPSGSEQRMTTRQVARAMSQDDAAYSL